MIRIYALATLVALCLGGSALAGSTAWSPVTLEWSADCAAFAAAPSSPSRYYLSTTEGAVYRSDDRGDLWTLAMTGLPLDTPLRALAVSPTDADLVLATSATVGDVYRTGDGAGSWTPSGTGLGTLAVRAFAFDPSGPDTVLAAGTSAGARVYRSEDGGLTWAASGTGLAVDVFEITFHRSTPGLVLAGANDGVYRSTDGGRTWDRRTTVHAPSVSWGPAGSTRAWAIQGLAVHRSDDSGLTFAEAGVLPPSDGYQLVRGHPTDADQAFSGGTVYCNLPTIYYSEASILRTTDAGTTWIPDLALACQRGGFPVAREIVVEADGRRTAAFGGRLRENGSYGAKGLGVHRDDGAGWAEKVEGVNSRETGHVEADFSGGLWFRGGEIWYCPSPSSAASTRYESSWAHHKYAVTIFRVDPLDPGTVHDGGHWIDIDIGGYWGKTSGDGGVNPDWRPYIDGPWEGYPGGEALVITPAPGASPRIYLWGDVGPDELFRSDDDGVHWTSLGSTFRAIDATVDFTDDARLFAIVDDPSVVRLSTDAGVTWTDRSTGLPAATPLRIHLDPDDADHLLLVYETAGLWETSDGGVSWTGTGGAPAGVTLVASDWDAGAHRAFLATESDGVWVTGDGWLNEGLPTRKLEDIAYSTVHETILLGTEGHGALSRSYPRGAVAASLVDSSPSGLRLSATPNPFAHTVTLEVALPAAGATRLDVLDVAGRRVRTLSTASGRPASNA